jgi:ParB-like chromosome segregation protein Spo0J
MLQHYLIQVDPQRIKFNPLNPRKHRGTEYVRLKESIEQIGIIQPPIVRVLPGNLFEVIDGEGRVSVGQELGFETIWVMSVGIVDDQEALVLLQASNTLRSFNFLGNCSGPRMPGHWERGSLKDGGKGRKHGSALLFHG